ncbi:31714_t:CDS:1, partial [Racocetra persica]
IRDLIQDNISAEILMIIHGDRNRDICYYNASTASKVAAIIVGDGYEINLTNQDILLRKHDRNLQKISEVHLSYDPLHYVLLFSKGDDGWYTDIPLIGTLKRE